MLPRRRPFGRRLEPVAKMIRDELSFSRGTSAGCLNIVEVEGSTFLPGETRYDLISSRAEKSSRKMPGRVHELNCSPKS